MAHLFVCLNSPSPILLIPPTPLWQPLVFSLQLCFCFVMFVHLFYFLDSTYKWNHMVFVFLCLTYFTWHNALQVHPCCCRWQNFILFLQLTSIPLYVCVCVYTHTHTHKYMYACIYTSHLLYPFICWWTLRLLPYLGNCK